MIIQAILFFLIGMGTAGVLFFFLLQKEKTVLKAALEQSTRKLQNTEAEFSRALSMLKHDLNSPLTAVILGLQSIEQEEVPPRVSKVLGIVTQSALQIKELIRGRDQDEREDQ